MEGEENKKEVNKESYSVVRFILELVKITLISLAIVIPVRYFLVQPFYVRGASMEPNFYDRDYLIINEISYRFTEPNRGDVVVFKYPLNPREYFIKRVIGLPGETIEIKEGEVKIYNKLYPQGIVLDESSYLFPGTKTGGNLKVSLGPDEYYLLGDNRNASLDSRSFGPVPRKNIIGKVLLRGWPFSRFSKFEEPLYNF